MFPFGWNGSKKVDTTCPNCGGKDWDKQLKRKDPQCDHCGFKQVETKVESAITMTFCEGCGCHYSNGCDTHPLSKQKKV